MKSNHSKPRLPHMLLSCRKVEHLYSEVVHGSVTATKLSSSLGYQMQESIRDLMEEFKAFGRDYELHLEGGYYGNDLHRWDLYVNGEHLATIDKDYGYDCFDVSSTCFKDTIAAMIELSDIQPLTKIEREVLNAQIRATKIAEHILSSSRSEKPQAE